MSLHADLLAQSGQLARLDPRRPKQANLRRAVSSAYYALFHLLASEASALYATEPGMAARIGRTLNHTEMKKASAMIANDKLPRGLQPPGGGYSSPADLKKVANAFVSLLQARHEADYDLSRTFRRQEVLASVQLANGAIEAWDRVKRTDAARVYLACFLLWKRWDEDPR
jgi:uncharacterized protein (UPF0332 family)